MKGGYKTMKKALSTLLAAAILAASLASCAAPSAPGTNVRVTSSDAADAAAWLTERLGDKLTGKKMKEIQEVNAARKQGIAEGMTVEEAIQKWPSQE